MSKALSGSSNLGEYRGRPVVRSTVKITNAGDGLSKAMKIEPRVFDSGDEVVVVLRGTVLDHTHKPGTDGGKDGVDSDEYSLVQTIRAHTATFLDAEVADAALDDMADRIRQAEEEEKGIMRLPDGDEAEDDDAGE